MDARSVAVIVIAAVIVAAGAFFLLGEKNRISNSGGGPNVLPGVEVRSYKGQDLSSINDFRENSIKGPQYINISDYRLTISGLTNRTTEYTYKDILNNYSHNSKVVTLFCVEGWDTTILWEGVLVRDLIRDAGIDPRANTVIFTAHDGYSTSFPLEYLMNRDIILAYKMNNVTLPAERGYPFQLVAEEKWGYKWIKWVEKIHLSDDPKYRGFWEQRGYSNTGDLRNNFFGN
jgi:DMSO/TMAO reductase YedYZ molybdopterin-dependent catalytic subunit